MRAQSILSAAHGLVGGARASQHGDKSVNHLAIAAVWNGYLLARDISGKPQRLTELDAANMMELLKVARRLNGKHNIDDYIDGAGYAAVAGEIAAAVTAEAAPPACAGSPTGAESPAGWRPALRS